MSAQLWIMCKSVQWKRRYKPEKSTIDHLGSFIKYYNITMYSTLQLDYYSDELVRVRFFNGNGWNVYILQRTYNISLGMK